MNENGINVTRKKRHIKKPDFEKWEKYNRGPLEPFLNVS